jgi:hypothetical protein
MILSYDSSEFFMKVYNPLLYYAYSEFENIDANEFFGSGFTKRLIGRKHIFKSKNIIDEYIRDYNSVNKVNLAKRELDLLAEIKKAKYKEFIVLSKDNEVYYVDYDKNIYKIAGIKEEPLELYQYYPCLVKTAILNYENKIISDGLIEVRKIKYDLKASKLIYRDFDSEININLKIKIEE